MTAARVWLSFAVFLALAAVPVFSTVLPPLFDYPNHLARMHLLAEGGNGFYEVRWSPLPNLAEDLLVPWLSAYMPLALAAKLFLILIFILTAGGALWLNRAATGSWRYWPLAGFLLLYTRTFLWGFLNYLAGAGLAVCGAALWLRLERSPWLVRVAVSSAAAFACFVCHVEAFAVYGLMLFGMEALPGLAELRARDWSALTRRTAVFVPQFVVPLAILLAFWTPVATGGLSYAYFWRKADLLYSVFDDYHRPFDVACFALFVLLLGWLAWSRRLGLDRRVGAAAVALLAAYLVLPSQLFSGSGADHRLPGVIFLLVVAGSAPRFPSRAAAIWCGIGVTLMLLLRLGAIEQVWLKSDRIYTEDVAAIDTLPAGAKVAVAYPPSAVDLSPIPETHLPTLAVARREAFVPTLFAYHAQQPIAVRPPFDALAAAVQPDDVWAAFVDLDPKARAKLLPLMARFDFIVFTSRDLVRVPADPCLTPVYAAPKFQIFRLAYAACREE